MRYFFLSFLLLLGSCNIQQMTHQTQSPVNTGNTKTGQIVTKNTPTATGKTQETSSKNNTPQGEIPENCKTWTDSCNIFKKMKNGQITSTKAYCKDEDKQPLKCLEEKKTKKAQSQGVEIVKGINSRLISEKYQLSNFIVGSGTQLAHAACEAVARKPGSSYNPLYIYGNVGLGKTHLLQATANSIAKNFKDKKVVYTTADKFIRDFVSGIQKRTADKLRSKYQEVDVLVIDDVQFFAGKKATQDELYNIFNILHESGKQIILSGDRPPRELTELVSRLQSRFESGIIVDVNAPDYETRLAILQEKAQAREFLLPQDVAEFIATHVTENIRELEGVLNQMIAEYDLRGTPPTLENVSMRLSKLAIKPLEQAQTFSTSPVGGFTPTRPKTFTGGFISYEDLIQAVSNHFGIEIRALLSEDRRKENMIPRQVAMYLLKKKLNYTYERIGNIFSGRNHTAVMYSCRKLEQIMKKDQQVAYELNVIRDKLGI